MARRRVSKRTNNMEIGHAQDLHRTASAFASNSVMYADGSILVATGNALFDQQGKAGAIAFLFRRGKIQIPALIKKGAKINYFDPTGEKSVFKKFKNVIFSDNIKDAIKKSDLIIIHTEWNDFKTINFKKDVKNKKFSIFDMRNIYSINKMKDQKIKYFSIGN